MINAKKKYKHNEILIFISKKRNSTIKLIISIIITVFLTFISSATNLVTVEQKVNSLKTSVAKENFDINREVLMSIAMVYDSAHQYDSALFYAKKCMDMVREYTNTREIINPVLLLAGIYRKSGQYNEALYTLKLLNESEIKRLNLPLLTKYNLMLTSCLSNLGELEKALDYAKKAYALAQNTKDYALIAQANLYLGNVIGSRAVTKEAFNYIMAAYEASLKQPNRAIRAEMALSVSGCYLMWENNQLNLKYLQIAEEEAKISNDLLTYFYVLQSKMDRLRKAGQLFDADSLGNKILALNKVTNYKVITASTYYHLSQTAASLNTPDNEGFYLDSAMKYYRICGKDQHYYEVLRQRILFSIYVKQDYVFLKKYVRKYIADYPMYAKKAELKDELHYQQLQDELTEYKNQVITERIIAASVLGLFLALSLGLLFRLRNYQNQVKSLSNEVIKKEDSNSTLHDMPVPIDNNLTISQEEENYSQLLKNLEQTIKVQFRPEFKDLIAKVKNSEHSIPTIVRLLLEASDKLHPDFVERLLVFAPSLSSLDLQICRLLILNIDGEALCLMFNITDASLRNRRSIIRGKLKLKRNEALGSYLLTI